jgi:exopolysaccharide biosynthesis polyprenyl glycosylphosphotransferase
MLLRLPWLLSRKRLMTAVLVDSVLFSLLYTAAFLLCFGTLPGLSLPVAGIVSFWLMCSYVIGRYHAGVTCSAAQVINASLRTAAALSLCMGLYLSTFWIASATLGAKDSRGFLLPLLLAFALLSSLCQAIFAQVIRVKSQQPRHWLFIGNSDSLNQLNEHLSWKRLLASITVCSGDNLNLLFDTRDVGRYAGLLVSDFNTVPLALQQQLLRLQQSGWLVLSLVGWCERVLQRFPPELLTNADLLRGEFSISGDMMQLRLKRIGDLFVSGALLLLTAPILLIAGLFIRFQDGGPVFYSQVRTGLDGKPYRIWKLRTMRVDAEHHGAQWVGRGDSRITPLGRILRLTRLDELPQLWAVLQGQMSLIGPRPERPEFEQDLERQIPHYRLRYLMRPGLSGWAQVNYPYGASVEDAANKLSYDLYYLRNFSFWLDLLILFKTIRLVFNAQGAIPISSDSKPTT